MMHPSGTARFREIAQAIKDGAVFVYPTETIYGIGGNTALPLVKEKIFIVKNRPAENPMISISSRLEHFSSMTIEIPPVATQLANAFWPGLLTLVVPSKESTSGVSIRVSDHPFLVRLSEYLPVPVFSTSANLSGEAYNPDPEAIFAKFDGRVEFMIDAGVLPPSAPSTVVKVSSDGTVQVIREGVISRSAINAVLQKN
jgi:L-threonylcarbamoyladenylate synthase